MNRPVHELERPRKPSLYPNVICNHSEGVGNAVRRLAMRWPDDDDFRRFACLLRGLLWDGECIQKCLSCSLI